MSIPENIDLGRKGRFGSVNINAFKKYFIDQYYATALT